MIGDYFCALHHFDWGGFSGTLYIWVAGWGGELLRYFCERNLGLKGICKALFSELCRLILHRFFSLSSSLICLFILWLQGLNPGFKLTTCLLYLSYLLASVQWLFGVGFLFWGRWEAYPPVLCTQGSPLVGFRRDHMWSWRLNFAKQLPYSLLFSGACLWFFGGDSFVWV